MKGIIDRFEGNYAVVELDSRRMINIKRDIMPKEAKEGDVIIIDGDDISIDGDETNKLKKEIEELEDELWN